MAYRTSMVMTHGYPQQLSHSCPVITSATMAQNLDTNQGTSRHWQPRQRHRQFSYQQQRRWQLIQRYQQLRQRHWQLKYSAAETLTTEVLAARDASNLGNGSQRHWQLRYM